MNKERIAAVILPLLLLFGGCGRGDLPADSSLDESAEETGPIEAQEITEGAMEMNDDISVVNNEKLPDELALIPQEYFTEAEQQGTLVELSYDT